MQERDNFQEKDPNQPILEVVPIGQIRKYADTLPPDFMRFILFGGDRISCCDEGMVLKDKDKVIGLSTIAPNGETGSGQPAIVGVYVNPFERRKGYGERIFQATIKRCLERGFPKIRVDVVTAEGMALVRSLPKESQDKLEIVAVIF